MTSREAILSKIRAGLGAGRDDAARRAIAEERIAARARHLTPERVKDKSPDQLLKLFRGFLERESASVVEVDSKQDIPSAIAGYLRASNLPARIRVGGDARLTQLPWGSEPHLELLLGRAQPGDEVGLTHASAAVAETGTLVLVSGADNPVTLNFLPETHIVVVEEGDLVPAYEDAWEAIRARFGARAMPRTVNFISGPSRTGDIGGRLVMGAHGPQRMCVVIVRRPAPRT
ncbi:MAG: lactate utilization protein C [Hyphomicrobiaceae bacterium]|nr:lactate utilization protein C [Hyphomicrobiaceae bacterium]